ncbi:transposase [Synechococcus sp. PCC 7502]|uniref:transposase n=1 Tax=Synechococcus sp. PCC 7502 TaxID=1173263 RepID=UPI0003101B56|nr:transposase [Synechococcus sp. PCC 7502]
MYTPAIFFFELGLYIYTICSLYSSIWYNWRDMPRDLPPFSTVYRYYKEWKDTDTFTAIMEALHATAREQSKKIKMDNFNHH